jgi:cytosine/uracil/thiamine/allantoin permease
VTLLVGPLLLVLLGVGAVTAKKAGLSGWEVLLMVAVGSLCILVVMLGTLTWGSRNFG